MRWQPGDPTHLEVDDVLAMLRVQGLPEDEQRRVVDAAASRGDLGLPSLDALREAGWLEREPHAAATKRPRLLVSALLAAGAMDVAAAAIVVLGVGGAVFEGVAAVTLLIAAFFTLTAAMGLRGTERMARRG
jgi:hypothetical protein